MWTYMPFTSKNTFYFQQSIRMIKITGNVKGRLNYLSLIVKDEFAEQFLKNTNYKVNHYKSDPSHEVF